MLLWLAASLAVLILLGVLAFFVMPLSLSLNVQGRAEPSGSWALALGFGFGPLAFTAIAATGVAPFVTCHAFGKQLLRLPVSRWLRRSPKKTPNAETPPAPAVNYSRIERSVARFFRALDPVDTVLSWWEKERVFEVSSLVVDTEYSFHDVALTGKILAGMYMLSGILPERFEINQTPIWETEDRVSFVADGRFRIWPGRLLVDVVGFVLKQRGRARREAALASTRQ
ncbi:MAG: hypothetical protein ABW061_06790 [Polyangiaceae bacterium]